MFDKLRKYGMFPINFNFYMRIYIQNDHVCTPIRKNKELTKVILFSILATIYDEKIKSNFKNFDNRKLYQLTIF